MSKLFFNNKAFFKTSAFLLGLSILLSVFQTGRVSALDDNEQSSALTAAAAVPGTATDNSYQSYSRGNRDRKPGTGNVIIKADTFTDSERDITVGPFAGKENVALIDETSGGMTYSFEVASDGLYRIGASYYPIAAGSMLDINLSFKIDGQHPFDEAESVYLSKIYGNAADITTDSAGNDLRPKQVEQPDWRTSDFIDNSGYNPDPFELYLAVGKHTLTIEITQESIALEELTVSAAEPIRDYASVQAEYAAKGYSEATGEKLDIRAELADQKSGSSIYPSNMRSNAAIQPSDPSYLKLNVISANKPGEWMSWKVSVETSGLYRLGFRVLQDRSRGMASTWRLSIDGSVPFSEVNELEFPYAISWYNYIAGGETPYLFYLEAGEEHTITIECTTGRFAETLGVVREALYDLNMIARRLTMVTGMSPDVYRDYNFKAEIPDLDERFVAVRDTLKAELDRLNTLMNYKGSELVAIEDILRQIGSFIENPRSIPSRLGNFRTNISTLGTWMLNMTSQGIVLDSVVLLPKDAKMDNAKAGIFAQLAYDLKAVIGSFLIEYNSISSDQSSAGREISVWVSTGRDQANIIRRIVDNNFAPTEKISVALSLVADSTTLLQATLAGKGPDVALFVEKTLPVNLAARGALSELSQFPDYKGVAGRFFPSALIPYTFNQGVYAIPNSQGFNVMFIRNDIFTELQIEVPGTWEEFYRILPIIQRSNMQVGALADQSIMFETLILQHGGRFYKEDLSATDFDSIEVLDAFKMWTGFYKEYSMALAYDAFSYFRTGIMPLLIADYTQYNQFVVAAPEIKGLWSIFPIPGTVDSDGVVNRTESATGTASILMNSAKDKDAGFKFLDWWTTTETQTEYSRELESTMGPAARYNSANFETIGNLAWRDAELQTILEQWKSVSDIPSIPSSYYVARNIQNAFRSVVYKFNNERETLNKYSEIINKEIVRKNKELGISTGSGD
ncbi:MAG: extracellular solute-binding protein [Saccharofermentanales bacterium]